jgi:hypothetical protein
MANARIRNGVQYRDITAKSTFEALARRNAEAKQAA